MVLDYREAVGFSKNYKKPNYKKFRGICPGWDNSARRPGKGRIFINSTPEEYKKWLNIVCDFTKNNFKSKERLIFINAWNEWAEGAYLEPDLKYGYAYLKATYDILKKINNS